MIHIEKNLTCSKDKVGSGVGLLVVKGVVLLSPTVLRSKTSFIILVVIVDFVDVKVKVMT